MPWKIEQHGEQFCVVKESDGSTVHCHATRAAAEAKMRALYASEGTKHDLQVRFGGNVKATEGSSIVEGLLIPFLGPEDLDHDGEHFTPATDVGLRLPAAVKLHYGHGMNAKVGGMPLAWAHLERREDGVYFKSDLAEDLEEWTDEERAKAKKYQAATLKLAREGLLGASSGAAAHLTARRRSGKGHEITRWPVAEASVTPHPSSPQTFGTVSVKSLEAVPDLETGEPAAKCCGCGMFLTEHKPNLPADATMSALSRLNDDLYYRVVGDTLRDEQTPLPDRLTTLRAAYDAHRDLALRIIEAILSGTGGEDAAKAVKALSHLWGPEGAPPSEAAPASLATHSAQVVSAVAELTARYEDRFEARVKAGRVLSAANVSELQAIYGEMEACMARLTAVLEKAQPRTEPEAKGGGIDRLTHLRLQTRLLEQQLGATL
jgi:hypothetical protein